MWWTPLKSSLNYSSVKVTLKIFFSILTYFILYAFVPTLQGNKKVCQNDVSFAHCVLFTHFLNDFEKLLEIIKCCAVKINSNKVLFEMMKIICYLLIYMFLIYLSLGLLFLFLRFIVYFFFFSFTFLWCR